jgi:hypothetical protein
MVPILGAVGLLAFLVASLAVGGRLLKLGCRTHGLPELTIGAGFVIGVVAGYVPETVVLSTDWIDPERERLVLAVTQVAIRLAALSILVFTWRVFRPESLWAASLAGLLFLGLLASYVAFPATQIHARSAADHLWYDLFALSRSACLAWGAVESLWYYAGARRRTRLGLADGLVTNRFLLWGVGLGSTSLLMASTLLAPVAGVDPAAAGWVLLESLAGLVGAVSIWLTFFPPAAYRRLVSARASRFPGGEK